MKKFSYANVPGGGGGGGGGLCLRTPDYARRAEPEPAVAMMLSHFSGGNPATCLTKSHGATNSAHDPNKKNPRTVRTISDFSSE